MAMGMAVGIIARSECSAGDVNTLIGNCLKKMAQASCMVGMGMRDECKVYSIDILAENFGISMELTAGTHVAKNAFAGIFDEKRKSMFGLDARRRWTWIVVYEDCYFHNAIAFLISAKIEI